MYTVMVTKDSKMLYKANYVLISTIELDLL